LQAHSRVLPEAAKDGPIHFVEVKAVAHIYLVFSSIFSHNIGKLPILSYKAYPSSKHYHK
jgi:hypothetical protein